MTPEQISEWWESVFEDEWDDSLWYFGFSLEVRPAIPGEQSAQWRCDTEPCTGIWQVAWRTDEVWADALEHAEKVHDTTDVWFRTEASKP